MTAVKRILRYLRHTIQFGLHLRSDPSTVLAAFSYADWAGSPGIGDPRGDMLYYLDQT
jgi:hypothetical protein